MQGVAAAGLVAAASARTHLTMTSYLSNVGDAQRRAACCMTDACAPDTGAGARLLYETYIAS